MVLTKQNQNAGLFVQVYWCIYVQVLFVVHVWDACSMSASRFFRYFSPRSATFFFDESPRKICFQGTILFLIASFVGLVLCDVLLHATTSSLEFSQVTLKQLKQAISSNTKKMPQNPGWLEVLTVREMTITCKAIGLGASRKFFGICKVPTGFGFRLTSKSTIKVDHTWRLHWKRQGWQRPCSRNRMITDEKTGCNWM